VQLRFAVLLIGIVVLALSGCGAAPTTLKPIVTVVTPADGAIYDAGDTINFTIAAAASANIARIELSIGGTIVATQVNPQPSQTFSSRFSYTPQAQGRVDFTVVAVDGAGASSDPFMLSLLYGELPTPVPTPTLEPISPTGPITSVSGCELSASFLQDVNVPDGTQFRAGETFTKTWRMKNTSSCDWGEGYTVNYLSDAPMSVTGTAPIRPTPSNANVDISVQLTAPAQSGIYTSTWRLKDPAGQWFGNRVFVVIRVP